MLLQEIWIFPVKSLRGIPLQTARVEARGLELDRRWMLVDASGRFLSQRELPVLSQFHTAIEGAHLHIFTRGDAGGLSIPLRPLPSYPAVGVQVWDDHLQALDCGADAAAWFTEKLGRPVKLVQLPKETIRPVDNRFAPPNTPVSLADGYPFLLVGSASVEELCRRLNKPVSALRFRPNLIVSTQRPFEEDDWRSVRIGNCSFQLVKPCARCPVVDIDPETGISSKEVLKSLAQFRRMDQKVLFGMNAIWDPASQAEIGLGNQVEVSS